MVRLPQGYCIDSTEVTGAQYAAWLATNPALPDSTDANCGWKTSYNDADHSTGDYPAGDVDWCDAYAYCLGVGKRLCGKIGGGPNDPGDANDASLSQWYNACSSGGVNKYPYGNTYNSTACNGADYWGNQPFVTETSLVVGTLTSCQSSIVSYTGVYDLSGNVGEWEDSCNSAGEAAACQLRGGSFYESDVYVTCTSNHNYRHYRNTEIGFRCCSA
jgi:formylglycine-generating enzyme required for sulfatase activity